MEEPRFVGIDQIEGIGGMDFKSLEGIRDTLVGLRTALLGLAEEKLTHIMNMKDKIEQIVHTAETMELERIFIEETERLAESKRELKTAVDAAEKKVREYL